MLADFGCELAGLFDWEDVIVLSRRDEWPTLDFLALTQ
jgi:hypothetical protein